MPEFNYQTQVNLFKSFHEGDTDLEALMTSLNSGISNGNFALRNPFSKSSISGGTLKNESQIAEENTSTIKTLIKYLTNAIEKEKAEAAPVLAAAPPPPPPQKIKDNLGSSDNKELGLATLLLFLQLCGSNYFLVDEIFDDGILKEAAEEASRGGKKSSRRINPLKKRTHRLATGMNPVGISDKKSNKVTKQFLNRKTTLKK